MAPALLSGFAMLFSVNQTRPSQSEAARGGLSLELR